MGEEKHNPPVSAVNHAWQLSDLRSSEVLDGQVVRRERVARWMGESISVDKEDLNSDGNRHSVRKFKMNSTLS